MEFMKKIFIISLKTNPPELNSPIKKQPVELKSSVWVRRSLGQKKYLNTV